MTNTASTLRRRSSRHGGPNARFVVACLIGMALTSTVSLAGDAEQPLELGRTEFLLGAPWSRIDFQGEDDDIARISGRQAEFWTFKTGQVNRMPLPEDNNPGPALAVSPDGKQFAISGGNAIHLVDAVKKRKTGKVLAGHPSGLKLLAYSPDASLLASVGEIDKFHEPTGVLLWDLTSGRQVAEIFYPGKSRIDSIAFSPDGRWLATLGEGEIRNQWHAAVWSTADGSKACELPLGVSEVRAVRIKFSPQGGFLAVEIQGVDGVGDERSGPKWTAARIYAVEAQNAAELKLKEVHAAPHAISSTSAVRVSGNTPPCGAVAFNGNETQVVIGVGDLQASIRALPDFNEVHSLTGHEAPITWIEYSPDGKQVLTASVDWTIKVWDADSGELLDSLRAHREAVRGLRFSRDGKRLLSLGLDGTKVWDYAGRITER